MRNSPEYFDDDNVGGGNTRLATPTFSVNIKRVLGKALRYWYLIALSVIVGFGAAFLYNRYATRVYSVSASIIVREGTENAAAEFLYKSNPLINPYRNFYNELYIMRSYPLLQQVIEQLNFTVSWYREGNVKTLEVYDPKFPLEAFVECDPRREYRFGFTAIDERSYSLELLNEDSDQVGKRLDRVLFGDTAVIEGCKILVQKKAVLRTEMVGKYFIIRVHNAYELARLYESKLNATWAEVGASVVNLEIKGPLPLKEIDFLNKFIERYQQYDVDKKNLVASKSIDFLDTQLRNIGDSLDLVDNQIEDFKEAHFLSDFGLEAQRVSGKLDELEGQRAQLKLYSNYFDYLEKYLKDGDDFDQIVPPTAVGLEDVILTQLISNLTEAQFGLRSLGNQRSESNPLVTDRKLRIQQLKRDILEGVKSIRQTQKINADFLAEQISRAEQELMRLPKSERKMIDIKRNYTIRENLYLFLMQKRAEAGISRASTTSDIIVVNPPSQTGSAIKPKPLLNYVIGIVLGLFLPFVFFVVAEVVNDKVQSKEDIEQLCALPMIAGIGHNAGGEGNLVVLNKPKSFLAECFRTLRSNLNYFIRNKESKTIMITSSLSGEGKTFTTVNLASIIALTGKRVVIIGADLRKPRLFSDFNLGNEIGLSSYLSGAATLEQIIQKTEIENLHLVSGGAVPPNPGELLMQPAMGELLRELRKSYDYILLDTAPLGLVADALSLIDHVDHTIFMVRQNYTPRFFVSDFQEMINSRGLSNISILFNDIKKTGPGYGYGYGYRSGYNQYGSENTEYYQN